MKSHTRLPKDCAISVLANQHWALLDILLQNLQSIGGAKRLAQDDRNLMMNILIFISISSHQLISGEGRSTQTNIHTLPAHHDFQPHADLKTNLPDIWYLCSQLEKCFHKTQNFNSANENICSHVISYQNFWTSTFPFSLNRNTFQLRHAARVLRKAFHFHHNILKKHQKGNNTAHKPTTPQCTQAGTLPEILKNRGTSSYFSMAHNSLNCKSEQSSGLLALKLSDFNF